MRDWIRSLEKAELHVHLEGSIDVQTLCAIDPSLSRADALAGYAYSDFQGFLKSFAFAAKRLQTPEHYALAARNLFAKLSAQGVSHVEVILSAGVILWKGQDFALVWDALVRESARAPLAVKWNLDAVRQWGVEKAWDVVRLAADRVQEGAVSFGLGGDEGGGPAEEFREVFAFARDHGMRLTCHAGETTGPASVWQALEIGAERIGHGIRAVEDPELVRHLAQRRIPLEVSITSNIRTGAVASYEEHPVRQLFDAGVALILNTDDPALFDADLVGEYEIAAQRFGFTRDELTLLARNSLDYRF
jgi:aminodeoxyfutalosine deaminase